MTDARTRIVGLLASAFSSSSETPMPKENAQQWAEALFVLHERQAKDALAAENARLRKIVTDVHAYATERCTKKYANEASASWVLRLIEGPDEVDK